MKVLVIGGGGREHALAWKCARSARVERIFAAPGNAGTAAEERVENVAIGAEDIEALLAFAARKVIDLTIVGPEAPLVGGVTDAFERAGLRCLGPRRAAARLEGSKSFSKSFLARHAIPSAAFETFTDLAPARRYIESRGAPIVVKADGLAAGKGVVVAPSVDEALAAAADMLEGGAFGKAGRRIVVEDCLRGEEASFIALVDGAHILQLASSQDHKARDDGDRGPNTGGMGAYSPAPVIDEHVCRRIMDEVMAPTVAGLAAEGTPYVGFLYAGLMIGDDGTPNVLEFNCRLGDPETQPIMMRLDSDLIDLCEAALDGRLDECTAAWDPRAALGVVMASGGYPGRYRKGDPIDGLQDEMPATKVFHAGTRREDGQVVTSGGRVLCVCALGESIGLARERAYRRTARIDWPEAFYRGDIGYRALARGGEVMASRR